MTEPKNYKKGHHSYTRWGSKTKIVHVPNGKSPAPVLPEEKDQVSVDIEPSTELGVYANMSTIYGSLDEIMLDFLFIQPGGKKGRVRSRVILPLTEIPKLKKLLQEAEEKLLPQKNKNDRF